jgi:glycogen debranching enzyme
LWNYYLHTGDRQILTDLYPKVKLYLTLWKPDGNGTVTMRTGENGDWIWGDWGNEKDMLLLYNLWYYLAIKGMYCIAVETGQTQDASEYAGTMKTFKESFNRQFWTGTAYRNPDWQGKTDDRAQALAVVSGVADKEKYPALLKVFQTEEHASPYMEKYIFEAMMQMGYVQEALKRQEKRFAPMVNHPDFTTLFEGWGFGNAGFGGGSVNHAWSGGGLTILSQYLCGIEPVKAGYSVFRIQPRPGNVQRASAVIESVAGKISSSFEQSKGKLKIVADVPAKTECVIGVPQGYHSVSLNGKEIWKNGIFKKDNRINLVEKSEDGYVQFQVNSGVWTIVAK